MSGGARCVAVAMLVFFGIVPTRGALRWPPGERFRGAQGVKTVFLEREGCQLFNSPTI